jgi:phthiodiolone/phenolphthiodiolone dimycocerosates ketoreductase
MAAVTITNGRRAGQAEVAAIVWGDRNFPAAIAGEQARALEASRVVDTLLFSDQMVNLIPPQLWNPEHTPMANAVPDPDSHPDAFVMAAYAAAAAPSLKIAISTDSVRRGPAELVQTMLTMANITQGRAMFHVGAGEQKQCRAFGWKRGSGLGRLEDLFGIFHAIMDSNEPIDYAGNATTLKRAFIGSGKPYRPEVWGLGGGPRLLDMTLTHADGMAATAPCLWSTPERAAEDIARMKSELEARGRDPDAFGFGIYCPVLVHDDEELVDRLLDNAIIRWLAGILGRIHAGDWRKDGIEPPIPEDWTYYQNMTPHSMDDAFIEQVLANTDREVAKKGWFYGTPAQVGTALQAYVDAGVTWVLPCDWSPLVLDADDAAEHQLRRNIEICQALKQSAPDAAEVTR